MNSALSTVCIASINKLPVLHQKKKSEKITIGICADLHQDVIHDGPQRLEAFINDMQQKNPDFIIQMGDFCRPYDYNQIIMETWNRFSGPKYHVIGNHDTDGGFTREQVVSFWKATGKYYSFDIKGYHFVVLDGNEKNPNPDLKGYARYISVEQMKWLENDLDKTKLPSIIFCHQPLDNSLEGIENAPLMRLIFERANTKAGHKKVPLVFSGHNHQDWSNIINDIHYVQINSMSYNWLGDEYTHIRYSDAVDKAHPYIKYTVPYKDPLWAYITIDSDGTLELEGKQSAFVGPSPVEMGMQVEYIKGYPVVPYISNRKFKL